MLTWCLASTMTADFCVAALEEALALYVTPEIFNTDQGSPVAPRWSPARRRWSRTVRLATTNAVAMQKNLGDLGGRSGWQFKAQCGCLYMELGMVARDTAVCAGLWL